MIWGLLIGFVRLFRKPWLRLLLFIAALALNAVIVLHLTLRPDMSLEVFRLTDRLPILFRIDDLARLFCVLTSIMFLLVGIYCPGYMRHQDNENRFYMFYLMVLGMLMSFGLS